MAIAVLITMESLEAGKLTASLTGERQRPRVELFIDGASNVACSFVGGLPASGSSLYTATNAHSGAQTPVAGILQAMFQLALLFLTAQISATSTPGDRCNPCLECRQHAPLGKGTRTLETPDAGQRLGCDLHLDHRYGFSYGLGLGNADCDVLEDLQTTLLGPALKSALKQAKSVENAPASLLGAS